MVFVSTRSCYLNNTILNEMLSVKADIIKLEEDIRQLEIEIKSASASQLEQMLETYSRLTSKFESENGYAYKSEVVGVLKVWVLMKRILII